MIDGGGVSAGRGVYRPRGRGEQGVGASFKLSGGAIATADCPHPRGRQVGRTLAQATPRGLTARCGAGDRRGARVPNSLLLMREERSDYWGAARCSW